MDTKRDHDDSPGLHGPDYFSLVIEWEGANDDATQDVTAGELTRHDATQDVARSATVESVDDDEVTDRRPWDVVDEASDESFPASDPPAWGSSHAAATAESAVLCEPITQASEPARHPLVRKLATIALGIISAVGALFMIRTARRRALM